IDDFACGHNGVGVVRNIDLERGVHLLVRVIGLRIPHHGDLVAKLGRMANSRFDAGMRYETNDDELMDAVLLELQIEVRVGEATGTPMLHRNDLAWLRCELGTDFATPAAELEALASPRRLLNRCNVFPSRIVAQTVSMMQRVE